MSERVDVNRGDQRLPGIGVCNLCCRRHWFPYAACWSAQNTLDGSGSIADEPCRSEPWLATEFTVKKVILWNHSLRLKKQEHVKHILMSAGNQFNWWRACPHFHLVHSLDYALKAVQQEWSKGKDITHPANEAGYFEMVFPFFQIWFTTLGSRDKTWGRGLRRML